jgi:tricorn protease
VAFSYAGHIWIADRDGRHPRRLTSGGHEGKPVFSRDGSLVAFVGDYDGTRAVYVVPAGGGEPRQLTYHPADLGMFSIPDAIAWTPDGKRILFNSRRASFHGHPGQSFTAQLFTVPVEGGPVTALPLARAAQGSLSGDGGRIAYVPNIQRQREWKRYRGGETTPIWITNLADSGVEAKIPRGDSNDFNPMWLGDTIYFLSDRNGPVSLFAYDLKSQQVRQVVHNDGLDIESAAASSDAIAYEQFGSLHVLDLKSGRDQTLDIRPTADFAEVRPRFKKIELPQIRFADLSPTGARVVLGARGEILTVPAEKGDIRNVTHTPDVAERDPAWSPDGHSIAYFSDESGEYALHIGDQRGRSGVKRIDLGRPPAFFYSPGWSPDSKKIAYSDQRLNYWYVDLAKQTPVRVDADLYAGPTHSRRLAWSPDSRWIAYTKQLPSHLHAVFVYSLEHARSYQLTDGRSDALGVAFDKNGQYLYFTASTDVALTTAWLDMSGLQRPVTRGVYIVVLKRDAPSPLAPQSDEENANEPKKTVKGEAKDANAPRVEIDFEGISQRILALPIPARNYYDLMAGRPGTLFLVAGPQLDPLRPAGFLGMTTQVHRFSLETRKTEQILDDVFAFSRGLAFAPSFRLSFDGQKMLYARRNQWFMASADSPATELTRADGGTHLDLEALQVYVDPRAEWKHMYAQVWRGERDFFYDPGLHGLDLETVRKRYEPYLENISTREDLNYLFSEMLANLTSGHVAALGGDGPELRRVKTGLLGTDFSVENGRYRFQRVYMSDPWQPESPAPLTRPGVSVQAGEYLLAVNGREVRPTADIYSFFEQTAGKQTVLRVGPKADGSGAREVIVVPVEDESPLRSYAWAEDNRRKVDALSGGRVAYVYLPDTYVRGYQSFNRDYFSQVGKDAAVIDARYNSGGIIADYIIDYLDRPRLNGWHMRYGQDNSSPQEAIYGPKVMLINEMSGSGGDWLPWAFREAGIGPLIGKRTWGGLVGSHNFPDDLLDGGIVTTPNLAFYNLNGAWDIENHGVSPDIEAEEDPKAVREGRDLQLEKAVAVVLELLRKSPPSPDLQHPPYPNYHQGAR